MKEKIERLSSIGFKRISDKIEILWGTRECKEYFTKLIVMDRQGRSGFPAEAFDIIIALSNMHSTEFNFDDTTYFKFGPFRKN